ncbi:MAG: hypothetical protein IKF14_05820, partial [Atopobiaceae bacterium]|nr:hypothetical protein [Atopobiaceae bacterium]
MARKFPRLGNDSFPYLETADPFKRENKFDYSRYDYTASAKLMRVTWPNDYRHVVEWESAEARDAWFDAQQGNVIELVQGTVHAQTERITLDVPYDVALAYNYVYMRVPQLTQNRPIDHEQTGGVRTICAFIDSCSYLSPSATEFVLSVDVWTTYLPYKSVHGCMLDRGHAPMWEMSATEYLKRPIERCANLLAPDVSFGSAAVVRGGEFAPLSTAEPMYVMASTIPYSAISSIPLAEEAYMFPPLYSDTTGRDGYQLTVNGYTWASDGHSYQGMSNPSTPTRADGSIPTGLYYYGIKGSSVSAGALTDLLTALPVFALSCKAVFVVPSDLVTIGRTHTINGVPLREVANKGTQALTSFTLTKDLFGYPERYADIAKLYTEPYAHIEVSDDLGNSVSVAIEDTDGSIDVVQKLSIAFPALEWRTALLNVANTGGNVRYNWTRLDGTTKAKTFTNADFANTFIDFGIPTYVLYMEARKEQAITSWVNAQQRRNNALLAYQSTMRSANTARANTVDSDSTAKLNAYRSADTSVTNTANTGTTATANTVLDNGLRSTLTQTQNAASSALESSNVHAAEESVNSDIVYSRAAADTQLVGEAITGVTNMVGAALSGDVFGVVSSGVGSLVSMGTTATMTNLAALNSETKKSVNVGLIQDTSGAGRDVATSSTTSRNTHDTSITGNNVALANTNATNSANTAKSNADLSQATGDANATYSRNATMANAKAALSNAQTAYGREITAAGVLAPNEHGSYSGSSVHEIWENKGIHLRAVTQAQGAIKQAGDTFLRYGYQLGAAWEVTSWVPAGARYCYWQSTDLWQRIDEVANVQAERLFESILAAGVTVWKVPEEV